MTSLILAVKIVQYCLNCISMKIKNLWVFNEIRIRILYTLFKCSKKNNICGCDLVDKLGIAKNLLSYHIKMLRDKGLIHEVKCGKKKNYSIRHKKEDFVKKVLKIVELI